MDALPHTLIVLLGAVLVLTAVIGGGFEVKELKIPKVGGGARILAGIAGVVLIMIGVGISADDHVSSDKPSQPPQDLVTFSLRDNLGEGQVSEQVRVLIDGSEAGILTVNEQYPSSRIAITVPSAGRYSYVLEARAVFRNEDGQNSEIVGVGQGSVNATAGKVFEIASTITGDTWIAHVQEVEQ